MRALGLALLTSAMLSAGAASAATTTDTARIVDEGMNRSQVMLNAHELMDDIGPRLTNSPSMHQAEQWAIAKFSGYGLANVHREGFDFGRGWEILDSSVRMVSPRPISLTAIPIAWTPATSGTLRAPVIVAPMSGPEHFAAYHGKLVGKIVLVSLPGEGSEPTDPPFKRLEQSDIAKLDQYRQPTYDPAALDKTVKRVGFAKQLDDFLASEGALAWARISYRDGKLVSGEGYTNAVGATPKLPAVEIAAEDYRRLARIAKLDAQPPVLEIRSDVRFTDDDHEGHNIIADIPGSDPKAGYVMAGAHFDSWVAGDGASDNGAGSVVVMEAARILRQLGVRPKRTIRFALWEELFPDSFRIVSYERLVADPETVSKEMFAFSGLDWDARYLRIEDHAEPVSTASAVQVRKPLNSRSVGGWRRYERHLGSALAIVAKAGFDAD